jgi:hypothetical protein
MPGVRSVVARIPGARPAARVVRRLRRDLGEIRARRRRARYERRYGAAPELGPDDRPSAATIAEVARLRRRNRWSRVSVVDPSSPIDVVMTSYGARVESVFLALESIGRGSLRPRRLILYLDDVASMSDLPRTLRRLMGRGLEVAIVPHGLGVHTKYWYYVQREEHSVDLVTSDDDILYPHDWLERIGRAAAVHPGQIVTPRAHRMTVGTDAVGPYETWRPCDTTEPSFLHFATSVSGQLLPAAFLDEVAAAGTGFLQVSPSQDDVWLHHLAVGAGRRVAQVSDRPEHYAFVPGTQSEGLWLENVVAGANDTQVAATYTPADIERLRAETAEP